MKIVYIIVLVLAMLVSVGALICNAQTDSKEQVTMRDEYDGQILQSDENFKILKTEETNEYMVTIYDGKNIIFSQEYPILVNAYYINDDILEFSFSTGNPGPKYAFYYSVRDKQISDLYENAKLLNNYIYFIEYIYEDGYDYDDALKRLVVRDIFNNQEFYISIIRDFSWGWNPTDVITDIYIKEDKLFIKYLSGEDEKEICEEIDF